MNQYRRYALYGMAPAALHKAASAWLGWDSRTGQRLEHPVVDGVEGEPEELTATPRKYGFHATIKPPFRLKEGITDEVLQQTCRERCAELGAIALPSLVVRSFKGFVAMVPGEPSAALQTLAADVVERFDDLRAPLTDEELAKRRKSGLTDKQKALLQTWGYPHVMDEFQFHMTLSGRQSEPKSVALAAALAAHLHPLTPRPFPIESMALLGEDEAGFFHVIDDYPLAGAGA
ncbi:MAG: DUF1045 domain-containing protein [Devosiaceae bacterium]|nr:DUF1045 domain-containing protein [Devosiaceae bacterium MH13]